MQILLSIINYGGNKNVKEYKELKVMMENMSLREIRDKYFEVKNDKTVYWGDDTKGVGGRGERVISEVEFLRMMLVENGYSWEMYQSGIYEGLAEAVKGGKRTKGGGSSEGETMVINSNDNRKVKPTSGETKEYREQLKLWTEAHEVNLPTLR